MKRIALVLLVLAILLVGCSSARVTTDAECQTNWGTVIEMTGNVMDARTVLSNLMANPSAALPGTIGATLVQCVDEGWRGY